MTLTHTVYRWDLCAGPHVQDTGQIQGKALELERVSGAYWRGDEHTHTHTHSVWGVLAR